MEEVAVSSVDRQLTILRRISDRGLKLAQEKEYNQFIDLFQHLLDEIERTKYYYEHDYWEAF